MNRPEDEKDQSLSRTFRTDGSALASAFGGAAGQSEIINPGMVLDSKFEVVDKLGSGGMGIVYKVRHLHLNKEMALKTFSTDQVDEQAWRRFQREAKSIARLQCNNIVQIFDFGTWGEQRIPYYAMELLNGEGLDTLLEREGALPVARAVAIFIDVANGLEYAQKLGIVHRDIKPANIFLCRSAGGEQTAKLVDFGVASLVGDGLDGQRLTSTGLIFGSPLYMSPEQAMGSRTDFRADIYSCGCALYETVVGRAPFRGQNAFVTMQLHMSQPTPPLPPALMKTEEGQRLSGVIEAMMAKEPSARYGSFAEMKEALQHVLRPTPELSHSSRKDKNGHVTDRGEVAYRSPSGRLEYSALEDTSRGSSPAKTVPVLMVLLTLLMLFSLPVTWFILNPVDFGKVSPKPVRADLSGSVAPTDKAQSQLAEVEAQVSEPTGYFSTINADGSRTFTFPAGVYLGLLSFGPRKQERLRTIGTITVPPGAITYLEVSADIHSHPQWLTHLRPDDIAILECSTDMNNDWGLTQLQYIVRLKNLKGLIIPNSKLSPYAIELINRLTHLEHLELPGSRTSGVELAGLKRLHEFKTLNADQCSDVAFLVRALTAAPSKLLILSLSNCDLTDQDLARISGISSIVDLKVSYNLFSDACFPSLRRMPNLRMLYIDGNHLHVNNFASFKKLESLRVSANLDENARLQDLQKALPQCKIAG